MQNGPAQQLRRHLLSSLSVLFGTPIWWSTLRLDQRPRLSESPTLRVVSSDMYGLLNWQQDYWQQNFLESNKYLFHPMWSGLAGQMGLARTFRREQVLDDKCWYRTAFVSEFLRYIGYDSTLVSIVPLGDGREAMIALSRPWGDRPLDERDSMLLRLVQESTRWVHRRQLDGPPPDQSSPTLTQLSPRHRRVLDLLLSGQPEKKITDLTELSPRTVHKYIEQIYRHFRVHSRAELMAQWITSGKAG